MEYLPIHVWLIFYLKLLGKYTIPNRFKRTFTIFYHRFKRNVFFLTNLRLATTASAVALMALLATNVQVRHFGNYGTYARDLQIW